MKKLLAALLTLALPLVGFASEADLEMPEGFDTYVGERGVRQNGLQIDRARANGEGGARDEKKRRAESGFCAAAKAACVCENHVVDSQSSGPMGGGKGPEPPRKTRMVPERGECDKKKRTRVRKGR